ncbi:MAG TPA: DUF5680 domain-containing protein [Anaerolineales bacterium]|nr:DUF5680 domain-containing protein [Anaerolineales bacterium]
MDLTGLNAFIVRAKAATYVGSGEHVSPCRLGSHDLRFIDDQWAYHDSYFGGSDFIGEEVVYFADQPIWAMNYYGRILRDDLINAEQAGHMIKASLSRMYKEGRFLDGFEYSEGDFTYVDSSEGNANNFHGREFIRRGDEVAYELVYHGGLIKN